MKEGRFYSWIFFGQITFSNGPILREKIFLSKRSFSGDTEILFNRPSPRERDSFQETTFQRKDVLPNGPFLGENQP